METASAAETASADAAREMTDLERYLFDLNGFLVVRGVFTEAEVAAANAAVDKRAERIVERKGGLRLGGEKGDALAGDGVTGREDLGGMLGWPEGEREVFRDVLTHPALVPYYHALVGSGYRMDHLPLLIQQNPGADGFVFHGGKMNDDGSWCDDLAYTFSNGRMYNRLLAVSRGAHGDETGRRRVLRRAGLAQSQPAVSAGDAATRSRARVRGKRRVATGGRVAVQRSHHARHATVVRETHEARVSVPVRAGDVRVRPRVHDFGSLRGRLT